MKAVRIHEHGGVDVLKLETIDDPKPGPDEVLIEVKACAVNHLDLWVRRGIPGQRFPLPMTPGSDIAGVVREVGSTVKGIRARDRVVIQPGLSCHRCSSCLAGEDNLCRSYGIIGETRDGGCAELVVVPAINIIPIRESLAFEEAAAVPLTFLTAWHMVVTRGGVRPGDDVLVHAGGSGVGSAAIQVAKLNGARVITTVGTDNKAQRARELGADDTINHRKYDFYTEARKITGKRGVDLVIDSVGADVWHKSIKLLKAGGRLVTCGVTSGFEVTTDIRYIFFRNLSILGSTMGSKSELLHVMRLVERKVLKPVVDSVVPLDKVGEAHKRMEARKHFGKIVLKV
ncbi:MAG TPA: zinc-binding dehydrogenase [Candidatus Saccharimonadales bacterium]|nr:zinc-binding dehydrogenase [Candidatus Saccharimonadales bacterium]